MYDASVLRFLYQTLMVHHESLVVIFGAVFTKVTDTKVS